ncbi:DUF6271 family protein [Streptomyces sp. NPDC059785]|uniref:DUF6271 family protein n=1 Tax=unclassified Streptomyces TaxID=2593676 RepID=UPI00364E680C
MRKICLTLPTNRECSATIPAIGAEAAYAAGRFDVEVHLLVLDSSADYAAHARALAELPPSPRVVVHHLDEARQRDFLRRVTERAGTADPGRLLGLMLPDAVSYGACTNRAFLIAAALGCESVHRRDSDSRYQVYEGEPVFPVHHELMSLGKRARDAVAGVSETDLDPARAHLPVSMVGSSFIGELSVDIGRMRDLDEAVYHEVVSLWAPEHWPAEAKRELVEESFTGAGTAPFTGDRSTLTVVDPMRVDMCNIAFGHGVYERVPLPPATDTIGSDYFLIHAVHDAGLPGVLHNRTIENYYTGERRTRAGFLAYQLRFAKFLLSMLYFNAVYERMAATGTALLDDAGVLRPTAVVQLLRESVGLDTAENERRLDVLDVAYRKLGGGYAEFADLLTERRTELLAEARRDTEDFALLTETWGALVGASRETAVPEAATPGATVPGAAT